MLKEEDYITIDPTEFHYSGMPLPFRDEDETLSATTIFPTREDAAYLAEWTYKFRRMFQFPSKKMAWLRNTSSQFCWLYSTNVVGKRCWQTPLLNSHFLQMVDDTTALCYKQDLDDCWQNGCVMSVSSDSIWQQIRSYDMVPTISMSSTFDEVVPLSSRMTQASLSSCISGLDAYEASYDQLGIVMPGGNAMRKLYWDLNNITCVAGTNTTLLIGDSSRRPNIKEYVLSTANWWPDDLVYQQGVVVVGCLAKKGASCKKTQEKHFIALKDDDQLVLSSTTLTSTLEYTGATQSYITKGDNLPTICLDGAWCDPSTLRTRSTTLLHTWYETTGTDEWQLAPTLSGNVTAMAVLLKGDVTWSAYDISSDISSMYDLSAGGSDPRTWHTGSSNLWMWVNLVKSGPDTFTTNGTRLTQSKFLMDTLILTKLRKQLSDDVKLQDFTWHLTDTEATVMQISDKARFPDWTWQPPFLSVKTAENQ